jgi:hypothetical protein
LICRPVEGLKASAGIFPGGHDGADTALNYFGSSVWRRRFLSGSPVPLFWRRRRHDIGNRYYSSSIEVMAEAGLEK